MVHLFLRQYIYTLICKKIQKAMRSSIMSEKTPTRRSLASGRKTASEVICQKVGLQNQTIFQDHKCTYKGSVSFFGRLYIGEEHLIFVSNIFGISTTFAIPVESIQALTEPEPKSIQITATRQDRQKPQDFVFTSLSSDKAFRIISALWKREKVSADLMVNEEENQKEPKIVGVLDNSDMEISIYKETGSDRQQIKMLEIVFPCSVEQFYEFFLSDNAQLYGRRHHLESRKSHSITITPWKKDEQLKADTREITATIKVRGVPLLSQARMSQVWLLTRNQRNELTIKVVTNMGDVPYHSYFHCQEHITLTREADCKCRYIVNATIVFSKQTYMMGTIIAKTFADFNEQYQHWSNNVKQLLEKKRKEQEDAQNKMERKKMASAVSATVEFQSLKQQSPVDEKYNYTSKIQKDEVYKELEIIKEQVTAVKKQNRIFLWMLIAVLVFQVLPHLFAFSRWLFPHNSPSESSL